VGKECGGIDDALVYEAQRAQVIVERVPDQDRVRADELA
jgi:hypothetical protein